MIELLVVMGIIVILMLMLAPAFTQLGAAQNVIKGTYTISGLLETARAYAKANNTYTWVGFYEEDPTLAAGNAGTGGRVIVSVIASTNGTCIYNPASSTPSPLDSPTPTPNPTPSTPPPPALIQLSNLAKIDNLHLTVLGPTEVTSRAKVPDGNGNLQYVPDLYQVGDTNPPDTAANFGVASSSGNSSGATNPCTFAYPLYATATNATYRFVKIIQFNPLGDATKIVDTLYRLMEVGLRPAHGDVVDINSKNLSAIQVSGIGGAVRIYRQ